MDQRFDRRRGRKRRRSGSSQGEWEGRDVGRRGIGDDQGGRLGEGAVARNLEALLPRSPDLPRRPVLVETDFPPQGADFQRLRVLPASQREGAVNPLVTSCRRLVPFDPPSPLPPAPSIHLRTVATIHGFID